MGRKYFSIAVFSTWMALAGMLVACNGIGEQACAECGVVESVDVRNVDGSTSGAGAIAGAVIGGVVGHQVGGGSGRDAATAVGAIGGGVAGHELEKQAKASKVYDIRISMQSGADRVITLQHPMGLTVGDKVRVSGVSIKRGWS